MKKNVNNPRPITVRYQGNCAECNSKLKKKGTSAYYWPSDGRLYCKSCGESEYRQLFSAVADEEVYQSIEKLTSFVNFLLFIQPFIPWFINICRVML